MQQRIVPDQLKNVLGLDQTQTDMLRFLIRVVPGRNSRFHSRLVTTNDLELPLWACLPLLFTCFGYSLRQEQGKECTGGT